MSIQLKNRQILILIRKRFKCPDADRMLPAQQDGKFPVGQQAFYPAS
jgi:hypothetical protein